MQMSRKFSVNFFLKKKRLGHKLNCAEIPHSVELSTKKLNKANLRLVTLRKVLSLKAQHQTYIVQIATFTASRNKIILKRSA